MQRLRNSADAFSWYISRRFLLMVWQRWLLLLLSELLLLFVRTLLLLRAAGPVRHISKHRTAFAASSSSRSIEASPRGSRCTARL